jgi:ABC-type antimicrobial peptide transport system, ATPase component
MNTLRINAGYDKSGLREGFESIEMHSGEVYSILGPTGSGKSRLITDIELLVNSDSVTGRKVFIDGKPIAREYRYEISSLMIAHLSQNMRFTLDMSVREFLTLHAKSAKLTDIVLEKVLEAANTVTEEPFSLETELSDLSGGQSRALMAADIAIISNRPVVLIDEIENAGIDKTKALELLKRQSKLVMIVTHDPHTALMAEKRIILANGGIRAVIERTKKEQEVFEMLSTHMDYISGIQRRLKKGESL